MKTRSKSKLGKTKKKKKNAALPLPFSSSSSSSTPPEFAFAIARIAVSQICQSVGYRKTHLSALETLTDIATKYLHAVAASVSSSAASSGRTQSNLFDIVGALHDLSSVQGFPGASDLDRPDHCLLSSGVLPELAYFVGNTAETPFAMPIPRLEDSIDRPPRVPVSFTAAPPHVPRWLPVFPERSKCCGGAGSAAKKRREGEELWEDSLGESKSKNKNGGGTVNGNGDGIGVVVNVNVNVNVNGMKMELGEKRGEVRFRIRGFEEEREKERGGVGLDVNSRSGVCRGGKRVCLDGEKEKLRIGYKKERDFVGTEIDNDDDDDKR